MQNESQTRYIGVDVCKQSLDVDLPSPDEHIPNTPESIAGLLGRLPKDAHLVCESTGGYENALVSAALEAGVPISAVPPQRVRHLALSQGQLAKTDKIDALLLSDYGRTRRPLPLSPPDPQRARLRELLRVRAQLLELKTLEASWAEHAPADPLLRRHVLARARLLDKQLAELEAKIRELTKAEELRLPLERLQQVHGVGEVTAWTVWAEMPELGRLDDGPAPPRQRLAKGQALHPTRPAPSATRPLHGRHHRRPLQPGPKPLLQAPSRGGKARQGRHHRRRQTLNRAAQPSAKKTKLLPIQVTPLLHG